MGVSRHATVHVQFLFPYSTNLTFSHYFLRIILFYFFLIIIFFLFNVWINPNDGRHLFWKVLV